MNMDYKQFIEFFDYLVENCKYPVEIPEEVQRVYDSLKSTEVKEKPLFTEAGLEILEYLQNSREESLKAKDIAAGMGISSRKVSGAIRKLCTDNFVDKRGQNPVIYSLSEKGKNFNITDYKESLKDEEKYE